MTDAPKKMRRKVPKAVADQVKTEFGHRCAICRADYCELHHIDENPSNNASENLIPLCSNCHQGRVHGLGGHRIDSEALRRYRQLRLRFAATGAYDLLVRRSGYLASQRFRSMRWEELAEAYDDLHSFLGELRFGSHFANKLERLLKPPRQPSNFRWAFIGPDGIYGDDDEQERLYQEGLSKHTAKYKETIERSLPRLVEMLDEVLAAQDG